MIMTHHSSLALPHLPSAAARRSLTSAAAPPTHGPPRPRPRPPAQVFAAAARLGPQGWSFSMRASMVEVHNEEVRDLLGPGPPPGKKHAISHDDKAGTTAVAYAEGVDVAQLGSVAALLEKAMKQVWVGDARAA